MPMMEVAATPRPPPPRPTITRLCPTSRSMTIFCPRAAGPVSAD